MTKAISVQCTAISKQTGKQCKARRFPAERFVVGMVAGQARSKPRLPSAPKCELGSRRCSCRPEVLLRLVAQAAARAEMYARLLQEAFDAAERFEASAREGTNLEPLGDENADTAETARRDLDRIFNSGGVAALLGNTYGAAKDVDVYVTGEAIKGLADLEAKERERCANFATKAIAAGLAERTVRVAEG